jgi:hypothetical protein
MRVSNVTADAQPGVAITPYELERASVAEVTAAVASLAPAGAAGAPTARIRLVFTQYDKVNAFARAMLIGRGQIKIDADAYFVDDATDQPLGKYQVSKQFAFGGIYGGSTSVEDVEKGFAKSVADILKLTASSSLAAEHKRKRPQAKARGRRLVRSCDQARVSMPLPFSRSTSSPASNISRTMSQPPTNSPLT